MAWIASGGAILILISALWVWMYTHKPATEVLDLRQVPAVNQQNLTAQGQQTLVLYRWARRLTLDLPAGSKPGIEEEVAIFSETDTEIFDATTKTQLENQIVFIEVDVDISKFEPGQYFLGIREPGVTWTEYHMRIADGLP